MTATNLHRNGALAVVILVSHRLFLSCPASIVSAAASATVAATASDRSRSLPRIHSRASSRMLELASLRHDRERTAASDASDNQEFVSLLQDHSDASSIGSPAIRRKVLGLRAGAQVKFGRAPASETTTTTIAPEPAAPVTTVSDEDHSANGGSSMAAAVFNLVNNIAGAGLLTLSAGMASGTGFLPAILICSILGLLSSHTFCLIGEACEITGEQDFKGLWAKSIGEKSKWVVDVMIAIMCLACSVIYSGILGDVFTPLLAEAGLPAKWNGRTSNILAITSVLLLPLCLIKDLSALAFTSTLGFAAIMYSVVFIVLRQLDGTYALGTGKFVVGDALLANKPSFKMRSLWGINFTSLVLASNLGLAYLAHYNAPAFYRSLTKPSSKKFRKMVRISFSVLVSLYVVAMVAGYNTFGDVCVGNILLNYHPKDFLSTMARLATGFSILFGFPLVACAARESIVGMASDLGMDWIAKDSSHFWVVSAILALVTAVSCTVEDISLVVGLTGAALGSNLVYICPSIIYTKIIKMTKGEDSAEYRKARWNLAFVPLGAFIGALGVYMTLKEA